MGDEPLRPVETSRRAVLGGVAATVGGLALAGRSLAAEPQLSGDADRPIVLRQSDRCATVRPFSGEVSVEEIYDYRLPGGYASETNGGSDPGSGPYYASAGTAPLQRDGTSLLFLYDGPEGLSLVVVHDSVEPGSSGGGAATFAIDGLPDDGEWVVRDDYYLDPDTGETAPDNYDRWRRDGDTDVVDWTWANGRTDGGVFRGLADQLSITIDPAFDEEAALFGQYYDGTVDTWQLLSPAEDGYHRLPLDSTTPVALETGTCGDNAGEPGNDTEIDADADDAETGQPGTRGPPEDTGPPAGAGPPDSAGRPEGAGPPGEAGPPGR